MVGPWYAHFAALKVVLLFLLLFYYLPARVVRFREEDDGLDRFFMSLIYMVGVTIALVHLLAFLHLYDFFSLLAGYIAAIALAMWGRGQSPVAFLRRLATRAVVSVLDAVEPVGSVRTDTGDHLQRQPRAPVTGVWSWFTWAINPAGGLLPVAVLLYSAYLRLHHSLSHAYLGAWDSYVHLAWTKYLGANQVYRDGIYPYGYHAVLSAFEKLSFVDPLLIVRFIGPLGGFLLVLSVYYVSRKLCRGLEILAVPGTFVFGLGIGLPSAISRQISALPREFAAIFLLPGFYFGARYLERGSRRDLVLFALCLGIIVAVHPYVSLYLVLAMVLAIVARLISRSAAAGARPASGAILNLFLWGAVAAAIALLPLGVGVASGMKFQSILGYTVPMVTTASAPGEDTLSAWQRLVPKDPFLAVTLALAGLLAIYAILTARAGLPRGEKHTESTAWIALPLFSLVLYLMYRARGLGWPSFVDPARTGVFFSLAASVIYGMAAYGALMTPGARLPVERVKTCVAAGFAFLAVLCLGFRYPASPPEGIQLEYDAAASSYLRIRASFPALDWTIVSPVEQYPQTLHKGWHYESWQFVRDFSMAQASDPSFDLPIPTTYVFVFAEKVPLRVRRPADPEGRAVMEARLIAWAEAYMKTHDDMQVFYEDEEMVVYMIKRTPRPAPGAHSR